MVLDVKRFQIGANDEKMKFRQTRQIDSGGPNAWMFPRDHMTLNLACPHLPASDDDKGRQRRRSYILYLFNIQLR